MSRNGVLGLGLTLLMLAAVTSAGATTVTFDFDSIVPNSTKSTDINNIEAYMTNLYGSTVTVNNGTKSLRNKPDSSHPGTNYPYLGNTDGATNRSLLVTSPGSPNSVHSGADTYLINDWNNSSLTTADQKDRIVINFASVAIGGQLSFDWEIFPQISSTNADITVKADGVTIFSEDLGAINQQTIGDLGHFTYTLSGPVHTLEFIDWTTAPVGIDNLVVNTYDTSELPPPQTAPEPATIALLGGGLLGMAAWQRRRARANGGRA